MRIINTFLINCFAFSLALKWRLEAPRKRPIGSQVGGQLILNKYLIQSSCAGVQ